MNKEWKDKWVAALRSGEYEQGKDMLESLDGKFCCLGVLCNLVHKEGLVERVVYEGILGIEYDGAATEPTGKICEIVGLHISDSNPSVIAEDDSNTDLICLNDVREYTFNQIATIIENQL